jgi:plastocyanin
MKALLMQHLFTPKFLAASALLWSAYCHAETIQVTVLSANGKPAANVVVQAHVAGAKAPVPERNTVVITQRDLQFSPYVSAVYVGSTVRFVNADPYDHHVRSTPTGPLGGVPAVKDFELRLSAQVPGTKPKSGEVVLDKAGAIGLGCHLHGSMRGHLWVSDSPYFAKTNTQGVAVIQGVPQGKAQLALWHPEQLTEQPTTSVQSSDQPVSFSATLNFNPKVRRGE